MGNTVYLECTFGISADRTVEALLDLGADEQVFQKAKKSLENLLTDGQPELAEILEAVRQADLTDRAKRLAERMFRILSRANARVLGIPAEQMPFQEAGDSLGDILGTAVCLDNLDVTAVLIPKLCEGCGTIRTRQDILPIPLPAVLDIIQEYRLPLQITSVEGEWITPAGAAIAAAVCTGKALPEKFMVKKVGVGKGRHAGMLRAMLLETEGPKPEPIPKDKICKLEANIDDCTGEMLGYAMERLLQAGARDVHYTPVFMKKNRPAYQLNVICDEKDRPKLEKIIFQETTTIGIRRMYMERSVLQREIREVDTSLGKVQVKVCSYGSDRWIYPEYESVARLARQHGLPYPQVNRIVMQENYD